MEIIGEAVQGFNRLDIPDENETIGDFLILEELSPIIGTVMIYQRPKEVCPFNRGNWVIDLRLKDGQLVSIKLPLQMTDEQIMKYAKPLTDMLEKSKKDKMN